MGRALWLRACAREWTRTGLASVDLSDAACWRRDDDLVFEALMVIAGMVERIERRRR